MLFEAEEEAATLTPDASDDSDARWEGEVKPHALVKPPRVSGALAPALRSLIIPSDL